MTCWDYDSALRRPRAIEALADLLHNAGVVRAFVVRDLKVRYKRSILGVVWSLASPLMMMIVLTVAFSQAFARQAPMFPAFVLPALLLWNFFAQTTTSIATEVAWGMDLWRRMRVPKASAALSATITGLLHLAIATVALIPILAILGRPLGAALLTLPVVMLLVAAFALGIALVLSAAALYFPDVGHLFQVVITAWMFATPVVYPLAIVPPRFHRLVAANPMTLFVTAFRDPLYANRAASGTMFFEMFVVSLIALAIGWITFTRCADEIPYRG
jgi:ABC-type polysaccharide/polyol phosphate export permease